VQINVGRYSFLVRLQKSFELCTLRGIKAWRMHIAAPLRIPGAPAQTEVGAHLPFRMLVANVELQELLMPESTMWLPVIISFALVRAAPDEEQAAWPVQFKVLEAARLSLLTALLGPKILTDDWRWRW